MPAEIYRVEIPIVVEDQSEAPLERARERVNRLEQAARASNERIRRHMEALGRLKIEPVMRIRDRLTAGVLRADRLVKTLGAEQAAPVLAAQDRISAVVLRINQVLDAMGRRQVDVLADLKGPLMEEINQARTALVALSKVQSAPVAELRGKLYAQLTRAMAVARQLDQARAEPEATLKERIIAKAREITATLHGLTSRAWTVTLQVKDRATDAVRRITGLLTNPLALLGAGAGMTATIAYPLKLAGEMEQAQIAIEFFTGSAEKGQAFLERLQAFAAKTPFEFPDVRQFAIGLMPLYKEMYGVDRAMEETIRTIRAFGDAAGYTGAGIEGMKLALLGFRQIGAIGKLQMEELRQVTENLLIPMSIVLEELGLTGDALSDLGKRGIEGKAAMEAIIRALEKHFAGGMEKMSQSLLGLVSTVKDTAALTVTAFGAGMAEPVRRILLDLVGITDYTGEKYRAFQTKLQEAGRRVGEYFERAYGAVKRFWSELAADPAFQQMDFGDKLIYVLDRALDALTAWLEGPGGKKTQQVFFKLGEIAATAWIAGLMAAFKGAVGALLHGNVLGALGLLLGAGLLGGGLILRGAWTLGKGALAAGRWLGGRAAAWSAGRVAARVAALERTNPLAAEVVRATYGAKVAAAAETGMAAAAPAVSAGAAGAAPAARAGVAGAAAQGARAGLLPGALRGAARVAGRLAWPLAIGAEVYEIVRAQDRAAAAARAAGGLGGAWAGAKLGALAGTAVAPGLGTVAGAVIGGLGGYLAGRGLAGWLLTSLRPAPKEMPAEQVDLAGLEAAAQAAQRVRAILESFAANLDAKAAQVIAMLDAVGRETWRLAAVATAFAFNFEIQATSIIAFLTAFSNYTWQLTAVAAAFAVNLQAGATQTVAVLGYAAQEVWNVAAVAAAFAANLQAVANRVIANGAALAGALAGAAARAASLAQPAVSVPPAPVAAHAAGGILTRPHLGLVAEAGPEAVIPLSARMRSRALALWEHTGRLLGALPEAEAVGRVRWVLDRTPEPGVADTVARIRPLLDRVPAPRVTETAARVRLVLDRVPEPAAPETVARVHPVLERVPEPETAETAVRVRSVLERMPVLRPAETLARIRPVLDRVPALRPAAARMVVNPVLGALPELAAAARMTVQPVPGALPWMPEIVATAARRMTLRLLPGALESPAAGPRPVPAAAPTATPALAAAGVGTVSTGPISVTFNVTAGGNQDVVAAIRQNLKALSDELADEIAAGLKRVYHNMARY